MSTLDPSFSVAGGLMRFVPEPRSTLGSVLGGVANSLTKGLTGGGASAAGIDGQFLDLISQQIHWQEQMQRVSLYSNIEKSRHETQMAPIRNVRVG